VDLSVPQILPHITAHQQRLLLRPPKSTRIERQAHPLETLIRAGKTHLPNVLEVLVPGPRVGRPNLRGLDDVDETDLLQHYLVCFRVAELAAEFGRSFLQALGPCQERTLFLHGSVIADDWQDQVLQFVPTAGLEIAVKNISHGQSELPQYNEGGYYS
jgi:hypothetical protein